MNGVFNKYTGRAIDLGVLSVLDVTSEGKVVSAQDWAQLWTLVINHINSINAYCVSLEDLRISWDESQKALEQILTDLTVKYNALNRSFVHYGEEPPTDEHTRFWVKPVPHIDGAEEFATRKFVVEHVEQYAVNKDGLEEILGDIETALDYIIALQTRLIGG